MTILVTRPEPSASALVARLRQAGKHAWSLPLIEYAPGRGLPELPQQLATLAPDDLLFAVSHQAIRFAAPVIMQSNTAWPASVDYYAIGRRTALELHQACLQNVNYPQDTGTSETLLNLPSLQDLTGKRALILRGNGGRELLAETLTQRGLPLNLANAISGSLASIRVQKKLCAGEDKVSRRWLSPVAKCCNFYISCFLP